MMIALQPLTFWRFIFMLLGAITNSVAFSYFGAFIRKEKMNWNLFCKSLVFNTLTIGLINYFFYMDSSIRFPASILLMFLHCYIVCGKRGFEEVKSGCLMATVLLLSDTLAGIMFLHLPFLNTEQFSYYDQFSSFTQAVTNAIVCCIMVLLTFLLRHVLDFFQKKSKKDIIIRFIRPVMIVVCPLILLFRNLQRSEGMGFMDRFLSFVPEHLCISILLLIGASYMIQDILYMKQRNVTDSLLQQQMIQDLLLKETRVFRHNIANLLYGFQGTLLSQDYSAIHEYYDHMVNTCTIINNENIIALRHIPNMSLRSLLVNKIQTANDLHIPFYVYTDDDLKYRGIQDIKMCEVIGILLDNAIEAAQESRAPFVSMEVHNADRDMEIVIRNTFREPIEGIESNSFFPPLTSSKKDHQGIGLIHAKEILKKEKNVLLNIYYRSRFVEASILFS